MKYQIFKLNDNEWLVGKDSQNGAICESYEIAESLINLIDKYCHKKVSFKLNNQDVIGRVCEVGLQHEPNELVPYVYIRYKHSKYKVQACECTLV